MTTILTKKKDTTGAPAPGDLTNAAGGAELAVNTFDKRLYTKDAGGNVVEIGTNPSIIDTTTVDTTNLEVTNIKAKDGTASATIANSTGIFTHSTATVFTAGTVSAPAITTTGDTNTGIFFPAADTIAFTEGGIEAMRINASGNVGIGTDSPFGRLDVKLATNFRIATNDNAAYGSNAIIGLNDAGSEIQLGLAGSTVRTYTNGQERMRVDNSGNVGIGTSSPGARLDVQAPTATLKLSSTTATNASYLFTTNTGGDFYFGRDNSAGTTFGTGTAYTAVVYSGSATPIAFYTSAAERMRIDSAGNVGIGTSSPSIKLEVRDGVSTTFTNNPVNLSLSNNGTIAAGLGAGIAFSANFNGSILTTYAAISGIRENATSGSPLGALVLGTRRASGAAMEAMRIDSGGNVGIGTASPTVALDVTGAVKATGFITASGATNGFLTDATNGYALFSGDPANYNIARSGVAVVIKSGGGVSVNAGSGAVIVLNTSGSERMRITSAGNVGIGTSSPLYRLHVNGGAAQPAYLQSTATASVVYFDDINTTSEPYCGSTGNNFYIGTNSAERMRITANGEVGIGISAPLAKLDIQGNTTAYSSMSKIYLTDVNANAASRNWSIGNGGTAFGNLTLSVSAAKDGNAGDNTSIPCLVLNPSGSVALRNGNVNADGIGITFPATQSASSDANTLDDYEEGSWAPTISGGSTPGTTTYTTQVGSYTKIGRLVTATFNVGYSAATGTGTLSIGNFPFTAAAGQHVGSVMTDNLDMPSAGSYALYLNASQTSAQIYTSIDNGSVNATQVTNESAIIWATITYFTA